MQGQDIKVLNVKHVVFAAIVALLAICAVVFVLVPDSAYANITVGDTEIEGYNPSDIIQSDINIETDGADGIAPTLERLIIELLKVVLPIVCVACVAKIIYNAIANLWRKPEKKVKISDIVKDIFMGFFWILFSWLIVEGIVFIVTGGETLLYGILIK